MNSVNREIDEWSDRKCLEIAAQDRFPVAVKDLKVQKKLITCYLDFYLGGKVQKGLSARDLTLAVLAIMPISESSEEFIWPESEFSEEGHLFFVTPEDKLKYDINNVLKKRTGEKDKKDTSLYAEQVDKITEVEGRAGVDASSCVPPNFKPTSYITKLNWYRLKRDPIRTKSEENKCGPIENVKFCIRFNDLLNAWESSVNARIYLKYFFAMVALFVMRGKAKTYHALTKYFSEDVMSINHGFSDYTRPHRGFIKKNWITFREINHKNQIIFAKLVITSLLHSTRLENFGKKNIIKYAVLTHTTYYGMGIINMLHQLASFGHCHDFEILFESLYSDATAASWNKVNNFFKKYLDVEAKQYTFHWAGIVYYDSVKYLSCSNNYELAVVIAVYIEKITNSTGIWHSAWVGKGSNLEKYKQLGCKMYHDYTYEANKLVQCFSLTQIYVRS